MMNVLRWLIVAAWTASRCGSEPSFTVTLGDGSNAMLQLGWFMTDCETTQSFCDKHGVSSADCEVLQAHAARLRGSDRFFTAFTEENTDEPAAGRRFAFVDEELMFRSTGTSNPGRNYPGFFLPTAGICPYWFQIGEHGTRSYSDQFFAPDDLNERRRRALRSTSVQHVFDKRYSTKYDVPTPGTPDRETWVAIAQSLMPLVTAPADADAGHFVFYRFSSLRQLVVSIRLGRRAWLGAGYGSAVDAIERMAAAAGLMVSDVDPDAFNSVPALKGQCAVNDFIVDELEFDVLGCDCTNVQIGECSESCCASKLLDMSYWETVARQSRSKVLIDVADHLDVVAAALPESQRHQILEPRDDFDPCLRCRG
ncbi:hypothetical protein JL720_13168 [Aureococcus anophagefferens]|nr:hypothetical protein JL720_13168 [Aureococcus anophagefferens]